MSVEDQKLVRGIGPHQPEDIVITQTVKKGDKTGLRHFHPTLFKDVSWLTASEEKKSLFCFPCLLFGGEKTWTHAGYKDINHLQQGIKSHSESRTHKQSSLAFKTFGVKPGSDVMSQLNDQYRINQSKKNNEVDRIRRVVSKIIDTIIFCGAHELGLRGHDESEDSLNKGIFIDMLTMKAETDPELKEHLAKSNVTKYTSKDSQNELLDCIFSVYSEFILEEVRSAPFLSVQADEATDIVRVSQFVIVLRFLKDDLPVERFVKYVHITDRTGAGLSEVICDVLEPFQARQKLICQTYDGAAVMRGRVNGVQALVQHTYPNAMFIHCYAHQLNLVLRQACCSITKCKIFFAKVAGFATFFSNAPKRNDILRSVSTKQVPSPSDTRWNYQSRLIETVHEWKGQLESCFETILEGDFDMTTNREAAGMLSCLHDPEFLFYLEHFSTIFSHVAILFKTLQSKDRTVIQSSDDITKFTDTIKDIRDNVPPSSSQTEGHEGRRSKKDGATQESAVKEACDVITTQCSDRFANIDVVTALKVVDPSRFRDYSQNPPYDLMDILSKSFSMIDSTGLKSDLELVYNNRIINSGEIDSVQKLYTFLCSCGLQSDLPDVTKVVQIALTAPATSASAERSFSTLKRIKTASRSTMGQDRLNALTCMSIIKDMDKMIPEFHSKVINKFASVKSRRADFFYC